MRCVTTVLALVLLSAACGDEEPPLGMPDREVCLKNRAGRDYCIDAFEASRRDADAASAGTDDSSPPVSLEGRVPWTGISWEGARTACRSKGKRLCERDEWLDACDGAVGEAEGVTYTYGDMLDASRCNTGGQAAEAGGARSTCKASTGTFDQSGNVWEWTGNALADAAARGGSWRSTQTHACKSGDDRQVVAPNDVTAEVGFRCCRDR
jgi:formylglycine-generating enzyme required for sulfatase activity